MQKLVTVYLDNSSYGQGKWLTASYAEKHSFAEEHLREYLEDGWRVVHIQGIGGASEGLHVRGWIVVLLER